MNPADPADAPGAGRGADIGEDLGGLMGHDVGEVGTPYDHQLKHSHAEVEGAPEPEEDPREEEDTHGHGSVEHMMGPTPLIPHETMEKQTDAERDMD